MACEGYFDKVKQEQIQTRMLANVFYRTMGGKYDIRSFWPLASDEDYEDKKGVTVVWGETKEEAIAKYNEILNIHNIKQ